MAKLMTPMDVSNKLDGMLSDSQIEINKENIYKLQQTVPTLYNKYEVVKSLSQLPPSMADGSMVYVVEEDKTMRYLNGTWQEVKHLVHQRETIDTIIESDYSCPITSEFVSYSSEGVVKYGGIREPVEIMMDKGKLFVVTSDENYIGLPVTIEVDVLKEV